MASPTYPTPKSGTTWAELLSPIPPLFDSGPAYPVKSHHMALVGHLLFLLALMPLIFLSGLACRHIRISSPKPHHQRLVRDWSVENSTSSSMPLPVVSGPSSLTYSTLTSASCQLTTLGRRSSIIIIIMVTYLFLWAGIANTCDTEPSITSSGNAWLVLLHHHQQDQLSSSLGCRH